MIATALRVVRRSAIVIAAVVVVLLMALAAVGLYERQHNPMVRTLLRVGTSASTEPVTVRMGDITFKFSRNYFWAPPDHEGRPDEKDALSFGLVALLPDFQPRTALNAAQFDEPGWHDQIRMLIEYKGITVTGKQRMMNIYKFADNKDVRDAEYGLHYFSQFGGRLQLLFDGRFDNPTFFIECKAPETVKSPSCERAITIAAETTVTYTYARSHLEHAANIESRLIDFLNEHRASGPAVEVVQ